jgi:hypothetical protein
MFGQDDHRSGLLLSRSVYVFWVPLLASNSIYEGLVHVRRSYPLRKAIRDETREGASKKKLLVEYLATGNKAARPVLPT